MRSGLYEMKKAKGVMKKGGQIECCEGFWCCEMKWFLLDFLVLKELHYSLSDIHFINVHSQRKPTICYIGEFATMTFLYDRCLCLQLTIHQRNTAAKVSSREKPGRRIYPATSSRRFSYVWKWCLRGLVKGASLR